MNPDHLNAALRSELAAIETYNQALEKHRQEFEHDVRFQQLSTILQDHQQAAARLRSLIQQMGATPSQDSGAWGTWSQTVMGAAKLFGDKSVLKALKEGEESGVKEYQRIAQDPAQSTEAHAAANELMTRHQEHIRQLDSMLATA